MYVATFCYVLVKERIYGPTSVAIVGAQSQSSVVREKHGEGRHTIEENCGEKSMPSWSIEDR